MAWRQQLASYDDTTRHVHGVRTVPVPVLVAWYIKHCAASRPRIQTRSKLGIESPKMPAGAKSLNKAISTVIETAFVEYAKATTIVLENISVHLDWKVFLQLQCYTGLAMYLTLIFCSWTWM